MTNATRGAGDTRRGRSQRRRRHAFVTGIIGVLGEVLLTAGVLVLLFLAWQLWLNDAVVAGQQTSHAREMSESWQAAIEPAPDRTAGSGATTTPTPTPTPDPVPITGAPPAMTGALENTQVFANLIVPRFGADHVRTIAEGIGIADVLNVHGIGHYPETARPGEIGNFALAAHRTAYGSAFEHIDQLDVGDSIWVETPEGWYRYVFRNHEIVTPTAVEVLLPVPRAPGVTADERFITLTSCNPKHSTLERIIAYGVYDSFYPRSGGAPREIAHLSQAAA